jgi:hypothetical protein
VVDDSPVVAADDIHSEFLTESDEKWVFRNKQVVWGTYDDIFWLELVLLPPESLCTESFSVDECPGGAFTL